MLVGYSFMVPSVSSSLGILLTRLTCGCFDERGLANLAAGVGLASLTHIAPRTVVLFVHLRGVVHLK